MAKHKSKKGAWVDAMCALDASRPSYKILSAIGLLAGGALMQAGCFLIGPCLDVGPCLSPPIEDFDMKQADGGDDSKEDMDVGPCLSQLPPPDMKPESREDMDVGPCLSPPAPDMGAIDEHMLAPQGRPDGALDRAQILAKLSARLPADILNKLGGSGESS